MILTCIVTHNRLVLTKLTVESYLNSTSLEHFLVVVDNASTDGTKEYLQSLEQINLLIALSENLYPGKSCNIGWAAGLDLYPQAQFLHRSDNDIFYHMNWDRYSMDRFNAWPELGQFGILDLKDQHYPGCAPTYTMWGTNVHYPNVGGNFLLRRKLWDSGLRFCEESWSVVGDEDVRLSQDVEKLGFKFGHSTEHLATHLGVWDGNYKNKDYREYYRRTYLQRLNRDIYPNTPVNGEEF